ALVTTGCGYFPIGALPTGYLPIGALPTGGAGGGGSLRGRSAAAAAPSIAKDAASAVTIFSMFSPLNFAPFSRSGVPRSKIKMPKQSESHNRKGAFLKRRDPFSGMCCTNTTPHSRPSVQSRFIQQSEPRCLGGAAILSDVYAHEQRACLGPAAPRRHWNACLRRGHRRPALLRAAGLIIRSSPRKRGPRATAFGIWIPACAGMNAEGPRGEKKPRPWVM